MVTYAVREGHVKIAKAILDKISKEDLDKILDQEDKKCIRATLDRVDREESKMEVADLLDEYMLNSGVENREIEDVESTKKLLKIFDSKGQGGIESYPVKEFIPDGRSNNFLEKDLDDQDQAVSYVRSSDVSY